MSSYIPVELRRSVRERAKNCCEDCRLDEADNYLAHEVDHIISEKHRGETVSENMCLSCFDCNRYKGSDVGSIDVETDTFVPLFHPRRMQWNDHFRLEDAQIVPLTAEGRVTTFLLRLNSTERLIKRRALIDLKTYPCN